MIWEKVKAGKYRSADARWHIERQTWAEESTGDPENETSATEWFLYCEGDMIDGFPLLRDAQAHVDEVERSRARAEDFAAARSTLTDAEIVAYILSDEFAIDLAGELPDMEGENRERGGTRYYPPLPTEWLTEGEAAEAIEAAIKSCIEYKARS